MENQDLILKQLREIMLKNIRFIGFLVLTLAAVTCLAPFSAYSLNGQLNINTATAKQLQDLPFIGHSKAQAIINYRQRHGSFHNLDELRQTKAIGNSTYEAIRPYITISKSSTLTNKSPTNTPNKGISILVMPKINTQPGQIVMLPDKTYYSTLRSFIAHANKDINISMFLFKITNSRKNKANILLKDLITAKHRGVMISLLLENSGYDKNINKENQRVARILKKNKIKIRFDSAKITTHTKIVVIDHRFSFVGSHNFTTSALGRNHEFSLLVDNKQLANSLINYINSIQ